MSRPAVFAPLKEPLSARASVDIALHHRPVRLLSEHGRWADVVASFPDPMGAIVAEVRRLLPGDETDEALAKSARAAGVAPP